MSERDPYAVIANALGAARTPAPGAGPIRSYAALGDSFTAGTGCPAPVRWADRLAVRLGAGSRDFAYRNLAVEGATSAAVLDQLGPAIQLEPDLVTVVCGVNDVLFSVRPDPAAYARHLAGVFRRLRATLPSVRIATATNPERWDSFDRGQRTRRRLERGVARFNAATRAVADAHGVPYLEVAEDPGLCEAENFDGDGLHPTALGHSRAYAGFAGLLGLETH